jgi:hypothetical protein
VSCRLWVLVLIGLHAANLGAGCLERLFSVVSSRFSVVSCEFSVVGCGLSQALFQSSQIAIGALNL